MVSSLEPEDNFFKKIKIIVLTCTWKRPEITTMFVESLLLVQEQTKNIFEYTNIVIDSEESNYGVFKDKIDDFQYYNFKNQPLSDKWNYGSMLLKNHDFDYVLLIGSDDLIDVKFMMEYFVRMKNGSDYIGILDMYIYDLFRSKLFYWDGYRQMSGRQGETIGLGRCLSKRIVEILDYQLWSYGLNMGLDGSLNKKLNKIPQLERSIFKLEDTNSFACDIKGDLNITKLKRITNLVEIDDKKIISKVSKFINEDIIKPQNTNEIHEDIFVIQNTQQETQYPKIESYKPELTKKQINYEKINSVFNNNKPKVISSSRQPENRPNLKLNSQTISKLLGNNKKR